MTRPEEVLLRSDIAKRIIENIDYGVYVTTPDRRMVYWNAAAERITGYSAAEVEGKGCWDNILKHVDRHGKRLCGEEACPLHKSMLCNARQEMPQVVYALTKGGVRTPVQVQCAPLHDDQGRVIGGVEIFRDVRTETADIELARKLQRQLVQRPQPALAGVEVVSRYHAAEMLSGDFYAVLVPAGAGDRPSPHGTLLMGDVSGHGVSSSLITTAIMSLVAEAPGRGIAGAAPLLAHLAAGFDRLEVSGKHVTAAAVAFDTAARTLTYASAGHCEGLLWWAADGRVEELALPGMPFGFNLGDEPYEERTLPLGAGDVLLLCTDGIYELEGGTEAYGLERMKEFLRRHSSGSSLADAANRLEKELQAFKASADDRDDLTFMLARFA